MTHSDISKYNQAQEFENELICDKLCQEIDQHLAATECKLWHGAPVWFIEGNPVVGYWVRKNHVQLLFWSGQSFEEAGLQAEGSFKAAEKRYSTADQIIPADLQRWLKKAESIQWDYKNIVKRKGVLERLK